MSEECQICLQLIFCKFVTVWTTVFKETEKKINAMFYLYY